MKRVRNSYGYESYRGRSRLQKIMIALAVILAIVLVLAVVFFFFAQQYIVYDDDGRAHLELPFFSREESVATPPPAQSANVIIVETPAPTPAPTPALAPAAAEKVVELPLSALTDGTAAARVKKAGGTAAVFSLKGTNGLLEYVSQLETAVAAGSTSEDPERNDAIKKGNGGELWTVARISCFKDDTGPKYFSFRSGVNLYTEIGNWRDENSVRWFSPAAAEARSYLSGVCRELCELGFDEILLDYCTFPTGGSLNKIVRGDAYNEDTLSADLEEFYAQVRKTVDAFPGVKLSLTAVPDGLTGGENNRSGQTAAMLAAYADKVYLPAAAEGADWTAALRTLTDAGVELVYPAGSGPQGASQVIGEE